MIKKLLSFTAASLFAFFATTAQNVIPNANFESWSGNDAAGWDNLNDVFPPLTTGSCVKATLAADIHTGTAAIILTTKNIGQIAPGTAATGTIDIGTQTVGGGVPFALYPDSLTGWYKYTPQGNDAGNIVGILFNANRDTLAIAVFFPSGTVSSYTYFKSVFTYRVAIDNVVTEALFVLASSGMTGGQADTKLYVDDLGLVYNPTVGVDNTPATERLNVYPNPVSENLHVDMAGTQNSNITIFDVTGKKVAQHNLNEKVNNINIANLAKGLYVYQLNAENKEVLKTGKFIVK